METVTVFDDKFQTLMLSEPRILEYVDNTEMSGTTSKLELNRKALGTGAITSGTSVEKTALSCSFCQIQFTDVGQQREHSKLDWHRYNLRRHLKGQANVTETEFEEKDDVSSISGSESESEEVSEAKSNTYLGQNRGRMYIASNAGQVCVFYRCLLADKRQEIVDVKESLSQLVNHRWFIVLLGGGHFAAAIFDGTTVIRHKTFHCYTVRAGQGGSQSSRDNRSATSAPRSAGASLRRYNEQALATHVADILDAWQEEISKCVLIPFRAAGPNNKNVLFGGKNPLLQRNDARLRSIPFATRRATYKEVMRVHKLLAAVTIYESIEYLPKDVTTPDEKGEGKRNKSLVQSREPRPSNPADTLPSSHQTQYAGSDCDDEILQLMERFVKISVNDSLGVSERRRDMKRYSCVDSAKLAIERARLKVEAKRLKEERQLKSNLQQSIVAGNRVAFVGLLQAERELLNAVLDADGNTALHLCADLRRHEFIELLLQSGADVCAKNARCETPYTVTRDKVTRDVFRTFAAENPDKFNYNKAQIPIAPKLSDEQLELRRLKQQQHKKAKRERQKEAKKQRAMTQEEEDESRRFALLSDREKHALVVERRILDGQGKVTSRCFECGDDMGGKVPFQYSDNQFCCIDCLKAHRMKHPMALPF